MTVRKQSKFDIKTPPRRPRLAVLLCDCGRSLESSLDFSAITAAIEKLPGVSKVISCNDLCQPPLGLEACISVLSDGRTTHVLIAACAPAYYQSTLEQVQASRELKPELHISGVNIREHCAWVHPDRAQASEKAIRLITAAVERLRLSRSVADRSMRLNQRVLVIGAGLAGMQAALWLAQQGQKVTLLTKSDELGGRAARQSVLPEAAQRASQLASQVRANRKISILTGTQLQSLAGEFGRFRVHLSQRDSALTCGAIIVATGRSQLTHPPLPGLLSFEDLARMLRENRLSTFKRLGLILDLQAQQDCAATRAALRLASRARQLWACEVYVFCRHLRVAGPGQEQEYQQTRQAGVVVIKTSTAPDISEEVSAVRVSGTDEQTHRDFDLILDLLAVADIPPSAVSSPRPECSGPKAGPNCTGGNGQAGLIAKLRTGKAVVGLAQRDNVWLLPVDSGRKGILFAGSCRIPMEWPQALADGLAAAEQAHGLLSPSVIQIPAQKAQVDSNKCAFCLTCYRSCPHGAIDMDQDNRAAVVVPIMCQACGICASECPAKAIEMVDYTDQQLCTASTYRGATVVFACENSALLAADRAGLARMAYSSKVSIVPVPCAGRVDPVHLLRALQAGAEKVLILGCHEQACKYIHGISRARARLDRLRGQLAQLGLDPDCVQIGTLMATDAGRFVDFVGGSLVKVSG